MNRLHATAGLLLIPDEHILGRLTVCVRSVRGNDSYGPFLRHNGSGGHDDPTGFLQGFGEDIGPLTAYRDALSAIDAVLSPIRRSCSGYGGIVIVETGYVTVLVDASIRLDKFVANADAIALRARRSWLRSWAESRCSISIARH